jgi:hypothetical protein
MHRPGAALIGQTNGKADRGRQPAMPKSDKQRAKKIPNLAEQ